MFKIGECFNLEGTTLEIKDIFTQPNGEIIYKVEYIFREKYANKCKREEGIISETILKKIPSFPF